MKKFISFRQLISILKNCSIKVKVNCTDYNVCKIYGRIYFTNILTGEKTTQIPNGNLYLI